MGPQLNVMQLSSLGGLPTSAKRDQAARRAHEPKRRAGDNQKVTSTAPWDQPYPNPPGRFDHWHQVLSSKSLCFSCCNNTLRMRYLWLAFSLA
ncbi:tripartite motif containing 16 [Columba livia]|uniref:Tripartite motif containing 16 n=1 Tax=Columba livia TaxID=8932 RepID=A0A2I0M7H8_COLLI|nr:tripartite motif containing 16 [Columba livia]